MSGWELSPDDERRLDELYRLVRDWTGSFIGYPCNQDFDYSPLFRFLQFSLNNVGDPFAPNSYKVNTCGIEREVIEFFAELMHAPSDVWGYVTNGGTEGNMYGLYLARELLPDGMVYCSEDTHYSVSKILRVLKMRHIMIKSQEDGSVDLDDLRETIRLHRDVPPIIFATIGTTMREGIDDVEAIQGILREFAIPRSYIHSDAALSGMTLPFMDRPPPFDFAAGVDSMSISGHKMIGSPVPCGVVLALKSNVDRIARSIEYIGALDTTLSGSRSGFTPLVLWYAIRALGVDGFRRRVHACLETAEYAVEKLQGIGLDAWRNPLAITVVFPRPSDAVAEKWQLALEGPIAHLIVMPHVTRRHVDDFAREIQAANEGGLT